MYCSIIKYYLKSDHLISLKINMVNLVDIYHDGYMAQGTGAMALFQFPIEHVSYKDWLINAPLLANGPVTLVTAHIFCLGKIESYSAYFTVQGIILLNYLEADTRKPEPQIEIGT